MDTAIPVAIVAGVLGAAGGFWAGRRLTLKRLRELLGARTNGSRGQTPNADEQHLLNIVENLAVARTDEVQQKLTAARADIADMSAVAFESKLVRRIDEDVHSVTTVKSVLDRTVHRIGEEMREDVKGCVAYEMRNDAPVVVTAYGVDERASQASTSALIGILPSMIASGDVVVWAKKDCDHLKVPMPLGTETILILPLIHSDKFLGCLLAFSNAPATALTRVKRTLKGVLPIVARAAYRALLVQELEETEKRDKLTGLLNRSALTQLLADELPGEQLSLLLFEGCGFKELNERLGRSVADDLVRQLSSTVAAGLRKSDQLFRTAGAQFAILARDTDQGTVTRLAERIMQAISARASWPGDLATWQISCAIVHSTECDAVAKLLEFGDDVMLYMRENKWEGRMLSASQVPKTYFSRRMKSISGSLSVFDPIGILQTAALAGKMGIMRITPRSGNEFWAYFESGNIRKARLGKLRGDDAVIEMVTMFEEGDFKFKEATAQSLVGEDDISQLGRSYSTRTLDDLLLECAYQKDLMQKARGQVPTTNLYVMAAAESQTPANWEDLRTCEGAPNPTEIAVITELLKLANGQFKLSEVFAKLDHHPTARLWYCAGLMMQHKFIRLNSLKVYARG